MIRSLLIAFSLFACLGLGACQFIIDIPDRELGAGDGDGDGDGDAGVDSGISGECNPLTQDGCDTNERCTSRREGDTSTTVCAPQGTVGANGFCTVDGTGVDDCIGGLICDDTSTCRAICSTEPGSCPGSIEPETCQSFSSAFDDQSGLVGVCQFRCDTGQQDCPGIDKGCYLNVGLGEGQCLTPFDFGGGTGGFRDPCGPDGNGGCAQNGCDFGFGPHFSTAPSTTPDQCALYCRPLDTHTGAPQNAAGDEFDGGACPGGAGMGSGTGDTEQCRFVQVVLEATQVPARVGMCVEPDADWLDCTLCDISSAMTAEATCGAGCVSQATLDGL